MNKIVVNTVTALVTLIVYKAFIQKFIKRIDAPSEMTIFEESETLTTPEQRKIMDVVVGEGQPFTEGETYTSSSLPYNQSELEEKFPIVTRVREGQVIYNAYPEGTLVKFDQMSENSLICRGCDVGGVTGDYYLDYEFAKEQLDWIKPLEETRKDIWN